jgi:hypothetical protein
MTFDAKAQRRREMAALAKRGPADPHPYVIGAPSIQHYLTIASECAKAGRLRLK